MTRDSFLARLRAGLKGLPPATAQDILADYEAHFADGLSAGRGEAEVAAALGDPDRLARELKAETGLKRWEAERNPAAAVAAVFAVMGLATIDLLILLPVLIVVGAVLFALSIAGVAICFAGMVVFVVGLADGLHAGRLFAGLGLMSGAIAAEAILILAVTGLVNLLVRYARLHFRLLKPAVEA